MSTPFAFPNMPLAAPRLPRRRLRRRRFGLAGLFRSRFLGMFLVLALFAGAGVAGVLKGGKYDSVIANQGAVPDIVAKAVGFGIRSVSVAGVHELSEAEILEDAGISQRNSLVFLDAASVRARLKAVPLIKEASVSKLYPNRLQIEVEERQPYGLWQKDGIVSLVASDGTPIDQIHDARFEHLPLVVGVGADQKIKEYVGILEASGDLRGRIRAGLYVSGRRWTLKTNDGIEIELPEIDPAGAVARFAQFEHDGHILEKDIIALDLRVPGRVVARLTEEAAAARADVLAKKTKKKGAAT